MTFEVNRIINDTEHEAVAECMYLEKAVLEACIAHQATLKSDSVEGLNGSDIDSAVSFGSDVSPEDMDNDYIMSDDDDDDDCDYCYSDDDESIAPTDDDISPEDRINMWTEYEDCDF